MRPSKSEMTILTILKKLRSFIRNIGESGLLYLVEFT